MNHRAILSWKQSLVMKLLFSLLAFAACRTLAIAQDQPMPATATQRKVSATSEKSGAFASPAPSMFLINDPAILPKPRKPAVTEFTPAGMRTSGLTEPDHVVVYLMELVKRVLNFTDTALATELKLDPKKPVAIYVWPARQSSSGKPEICLACDTSILPGTDPFGFLVRDGRWQKAGELWRTPVKRALQEQLSELYLARLDPKSGRFLCGTSADAVKAILAHQTSITDAVNEAEREKNSLPTLAFFRDHSAVVRKPNQDSPRKYRTMTLTINREGKCRASYSGVLPADQKEVAEEFEASVGVSSKWRSADEGTIYTELQLASQPNNPGLPKVDDSLLVGVLLIE